MFLAPGIPLVVDVCAKISRSLKEWVQGRAGAHEERLPELAAVEFTGWTF